MPTLPFFETCNTFIFDIKNELCFVVSDLDTHIELCVYDGRVKWHFRQLS